MPNNILVIGNGFDIAHGLNTRYIEFINFCDMVGNITYKEGEDINKLLSQLNNNKLSLNFSFEPSVYRKLRNYFTNDKLSEERNKFVKKCRSNFWLEYVLKHKDTMGERWTDFEYVIGSMIEAHAYVANNLKDIKGNGDFRYKKNRQNIVEIYDMLNNYEDDDLHNRLVKVKKEMEKGLIDITWMLEVYLTRFLNDKRKTIDLFNLVDFRYILSFNYTSTYTKMYKRNTEIHYVHGNADANRSFEDNNMVFGIEKNIKNVDDVSKHDYLEFQKYYQRIIKKTGLKYKSWLEIKNEELRTFSNECNIFIYGHSLDYPDGDIIKDLVECEKSRVIIFYHNKDAFKSLVANLIKIFSEDEVIKFTEEEKIIFMKTSELDKIEECLKLRNKEKINKIG